MGSLFRWIESSLQRHLSSLGIVESKGSENSSEETSDTKICSRSTNDDEIYSMFGHSSNLQSRNDVSECRWDGEMQMAEVVERKGQMWTTTGLVRSSKLYCTIEETLFLVELGALVMLDDNDARLSLEQVYKKLADRKNGCWMEAFQVYRHLKSLGYIVGRCGIPWTMKGVKSIGKLTSIEDTPESSGVEGMETMETSSIVDSVDSIQTDEARAVFDVYSPNSKFRKSCPGNPRFVPCLTRGYPPSMAEVQDLETQCGDIPLKFCHVEHGVGRVSYFSFNSLELPVLP